MGAVPREGPGAIGAAGALAALSDARPACAGLSAETAGVGLTAPAKTALREIARDGSLFSDEMARPNRAPRCLPGWQGLAAASRDLTPGRHPGLLPVGVCT
jgi:hypothetical protein